MACGGGSQLTKALLRRAALASRHGAGASAAAPAAAALSQEARPQRHTRQSSPWPSSSSSSSLSLSPRVAAGGYQHQQSRSVTYMPKPGSGAARPVTLILGDGTGPLVTDAVVQVMEAMRAPLYFETFECSGSMSCMPAEILDSIRRNKVCLKGGLRTPVGGGTSSLNMQLRKELDLFASLVMCFNVPGVDTRHENVNVVVIRENTEGEYSGLEHEVVPGVVESLKVITKHNSERIAKYAFEYAYLNARKTVTAVHKANIMKLADGLFLESCREVAKQYKGIKYNEVIVDNCCMQLVARPEQFDVMVTPNLYGTLVANTAAGIAGGTGVMPGGNVGLEHAVFEQGASAGNVGNEWLVQNKAANPTALLLSSAMMLRHLQFPSFADRLEHGVYNVLAERKVRTKELGGDSTTQEFVDAVIAAVEKAPVGKFIPSRK
ncbi:hypothetical protein CBR_g35041 [Chara braunii]|uniref:Isopropylmalate dehydrogenase-like domain-containing protein n=1 Tax=Chara braunii TaxID=69332 RepID=A0A388LK23_CHABU|nr:hypothetical protein CBR_g35041 [Chara braunii]|eukprot:GBG82676.1 hypothetical protein CBR_g35041 [Chara braunii]